MKTEEIEFRTENRNISDLIDCSYNPRILTKKQYADLKKSFKKFGYVEICVINLDNTIIAGHQRVHVMKDLGWSDQDIDVRVPNRQLNKKEFDEYLIRSNQNGGGFDDDLLANDFEMDELVEWGFDLEYFGISDEDEEEVEEDEDGEDSEILKKDVISKLGDVYNLNNHVLACGDSTNLELVTRIIDEEKIDLVYTDPPYGIDEKTDRISEGRGGSCKANSFDKIIGDKSIDTAISGYAVAESVSPIICYWGGNYFCNKLPPSSCWLVWDKRVEENQRDDNSDCELAYVKHPKKKSVRIFRHLWKGMIKGSEHGESRIHPTQKPIALAKWCIKELNPKARTILDLFTGSGSTLIACESMKLNFIGFELSTSYMDSIISRWIKYMIKNDKDISIKRNGEEIDYNIFILEEDDIND